MLGSPHPLAERAAVVAAIAPCYAERHRNIRLRPLAGALVLREPGMLASEVADPRLLAAGSGSRRPTRAEGRPRPARPPHLARARAVRAALAFALALTCWPAPA